MEHTIVPAAQSSGRADILAARVALAHLVAGGPVAGDALASDAQARLADWLAEIADHPAMAALAKLLSDYPAANGLLAGFAHSAPYLWDLVRADPARLL